MYTITSCKGKNSKVYVLFILCMANNTRSIIDKRIEGSFGTGTFFCSTNLITVLVDGI
jgi:hypothetical protein